MKVRRFVSSVLFVSVAYTVYAHKHRQTYAQRFIASSLLPIFFYIFFFVFLFVRVVVGHFSDGVGGSHSLISAYCK